jgi:hypothetical protein
VSAGQIYQSSAWGYAAALWALIFTFLHIVWWAGWYVLLPQEEARRSFSRPWFRVYDLVVAGACLLAVFVALALVQSWGRRVPRLLLSSLAWIGTVLLVIRGTGSIVQLVITRRYIFQPMHLYEISFWLGAVLFSMTLLRARRPRSVPTSDAAAEQLG